MEVVKNLPGIDTISIGCCFFQSFDRNAMEFSYQFPSIFGLKILGSFVGIEMTSIIGSYFYPTHRIFGSDPKNGDFIFSNILQVRSMFYGDCALSVSGQTNAGPEEKY